jgi:hypothetical protein
MLYTPKQSYQSFEYNNWGAIPSVTIGKSVIPGASNAEGSWTMTIDAANVKTDIYGTHIQIIAGATSSWAKLHVMDIGVDPAGGTAYQPIISNLVCGNTPPVTSGGAREHYFPYYIKANSSIAVRFSGSNVTPGTVFVAQKIFGKPSDQSMFPKGTYSETYGVTGTEGTSIIPGTNVEGNWTLLGTTSRPIWWWQLGYQLQNNNLTTEGTVITLAVGDNTYKQIIFKMMHIGNTAEAACLYIQPNILWQAAYRPVPAGTNVYVRARCNSAPDTGYQVGVIGIGG